MDKKSILLIDDEQSILDLLGDILEMEGYRLTAEDKPARALTLLEKQEFDLVITDLQMPEINGLEIVRKVKESAPDTGVIILTGHGSVESASDAVELGVDAYLQKPIRNREIIKAVRQVLKNKQTHLENKRLKTLIELSSIVYQVTDFNLAQDMILDTCTEYLDLRQVGIAFVQDAPGHYKITAQRNLNKEWVSELTFVNYDEINGKRVHTSAVTKIDDLHGKLRINKHELEIDPEITAIYLFPIRFQETLSAYFIVAVTKADSFTKKADLDFFKLFVNLMAPVLHSFDVVKKIGTSTESIISKIIKDRIYEARLILNPISFGLMRIVARDRFEDSLLLEDAVRMYQSALQKKAEDKGELIWLTVDTVFFIYPNADLFKVEAAAADLKNELEKIYIQEQGRATFSIKYTCTSYPQSGENAAEIINHLWLKLFDEIFCDRD